jgi:glycosyltransferase involved in cell wall biosynthesis
VEALASGVVHLIQDPEMRRQMGQVGRQRVEQLFNLERHVDAVQKVYDEVLAEK